MKTSRNHPPLQHCSVCGSDWFFVHDCPPGAEKRVPRPEATIHMSDLLNHIEELERLVKEQQRTITDLMLELAEVRMEKDRTRRAAIEEMA